MNQVLVLTLGVYTLLVSDLVPATGSFCCLVGIGGTQTILFGDYIVRVKTQGRRESVRIIHRTFYCSVCAMNCQPIQDRDLDGQNSLGIYHYASLMSNAMFGKVGFDWTHVSRPSQQGLQNA